MIFSVILNLPWSILGLVQALIAVPKRITVSKNPPALVFEGRSFWWLVPFPFYRRSRGFALGNIVVLGPKKEERDLEHELVHVEQFMRYPLIFPLVNAWEVLRHGYRQSKFENEAYERAGNSYKGHS